MTWVLVGFPRAGGSFPRQGGDGGDVTLGQKPFKPRLPPFPPLPGQHMTCVNGVVARARREPQSGRGEPSALEPVRETKHKRHRY